MRKDGTIEGTSEIKGAAQEILEVQSTWSLSDGFESWAAIINQERDATLSETLEIVSKLEIPRSQLAQQYDVHSDKGWIFNNGSLHI